MPTFTEYKVNKNLLTGRSIGMKEMKTNAARRENKPHIGIFGRCNSGKSSLLNYIVGADAAIVSPESGTTTDVVRKSYEILDFGPVIFIDTAGVDDDSPLGRQRVARTMATIGQIDLALLVFREWGAPEQGLVRAFDKADVPYTLVNNGGGISVAGHVVIDVDARGDDAAEREKILDEIKRRLPETSYSAPSMFRGRVVNGDVVFLVCPIDSEAPAGRMILPQVQAIRELLDTHALSVVVQPAEIAAVLEFGIRPALVVTDSQVYAEVRAQVPPEIEVTSFSILLAAAKGNLDLYLKGLEKVDRLKNGDRILIAESCTHQVSCDDIGRVKIPRWLEEYSGKKFQFTVVSGLAPLPDDLASYALMIQCGGCMVTRSQLHNRLRLAAEAGVSVVNYGMLIKKIRI